MGRPSKYDNMSKEEILAAMQEKKKRQASCQWKKTCNLTLKEGEFMETEIFPKYDCENVTQFIKKICRGELVVSRQNRQNPTNKPHNPNNKRLVNLSQGVFFMPCFV